MGNVIPGFFEKINGTFICYMATVLCFHLERLRTGEHRPENFTVESAKGKETRSGYVILTVVAIFLRQMDTWQKVYVGSNTEETFLNHFRNQIDDRCVLRGIVIPRFQPTSGHTDGHSLEWLASIQGTGQQCRFGKPKSHNIAYEKDMESDDENPSPPKPL